MHQLDNPYLFYFDKKDQINKNLNAEIPLSPEITDFNQGSLGNCGFVATIGCLALHPQGHNLLFSTIYPPVYNPIGIYSVRLIVNSEVRYMLIDDQIPYTGYSSMTHGAEFWYLLIEKAFAKLKGGYSKLGGCMEDYLGIKSSSNVSINSDNKDRLWKEKFLPIFQTNQSTTYQGTGTHSNYLVNAHAYSIIDAAEWSDIRLVRLHNPWNIANYHGPFSPSSSEWEKVPQAIQIETFQRDRFSNLTFWMPYDLYVEDLPKISEMCLDNKLPNALKQIANTDSIQD